MAGEGAKSAGPLQLDSKDWDKLLGEREGEGAEPLSLVVVPGKSPQAKEMDEKVSNNLLVSDLRNMTDKQLQQSADRIRRILPTLSLTLKDGGEKLKRSLQLHEDELKRRRLLPLQKVIFPEVIDVDMDDDYEDIMLLDTEVDTKRKGKAPNTRAMRGHSSPSIHNKIELYDEMAVVVGKDLATGSFAKSFVDLETPFVPKTSVETSEETSVEQKNVTSARSSEVRATSSGTQQHRKRNRSNEDIEKMSQQLGEVAAALNKISANKLDINQLHDEIMKIEGYSEEFLDLVFDHLVQNEKLGKAFMAKSHRLRLISLERFKKDWGVE